MASRIWEKVNPHMEKIKGIVQLGDIVVALWQKTSDDQTEGGILLPDGYRDEDIYQGKSGLVIMMGPEAFADDPLASPPIRWPIKPKLGDWVVFRVSDGWPFMIGDQSCRLVNERAVRLIVERPDVVY
jgi:co-chaperonin GroES (HSP10)